MGWLRDRLARLGVRGPAGRDAVATAVLTVLGLARIPVTLLVNGGRLPVPAWQLAAANLASIRQGRETLTSLRQLVGVVRESDEAGRRAPQPTLERLDELAAGAREGGMAVETTWSGAGRPLPPAVDLAAYRIVQEALTNACRHAPGAAVSVAVAVDDAGVRVVAGGHGLVAPRVTRRLSVSPSTVKTHVGSLLAKLGCRDRVQAVVYAYEHGVVTPGDDATGPGADGEEGRR